METCKNPLKRRIEFLNPGLGQHPAVSLPGGEVILRVFLALGAIGVALALIAAAVVEHRTIQKKRGRGPYADPQRSNRALFRGDKTHRIKRSLARAKAADGMPQI